MKGSHKRKEACEQIPSSLNRTRLKIQTGENRKSGRPGGGHGRTKVWKGCGPRNKEKKLRTLGVFKFPIETPREEKSLEQPTPVEK